MGLYIRKAISFGPLRFNLSKSGVGLSAGIRGFRLGTNSKGNYIHMGRGGLYYRQSLPTAPNGPNPVHSNQEGGFNTPYASMQMLNTIHVDFRHKNEEDNIINDIKIKKSKTKLLPFAISIVIIIIIITILMKIQNLVLPIELIVGCCLISLVKIFDKIRTTAVAFYAFEPPLDDAYDQFQEAALKLGKCEKVWAEYARGKVHDGRYHAGSSFLFERADSEIILAENIILVANITPIKIKLHQSDLWLFPDRILLSDPTGCTSFSYNDITLNTASIKVAEDTSVPKGAQIIGYTWRYVNKNGSPDRRFAGNGQVPICLYGTLEFRCAEGLVGRLFFSNPEAPLKFVKDFEKYRMALLDETIGKLDLNSDSKHPDNNGEIYQLMQRYGLTTIGAALQGDRGPLISFMNALVDNSFANINSLGVTDEDEILVYLVASICTKIKYVCSNSKEFCEIATYLHNSFNSIPDAKISNDLILCLVSFMEKNGYNFQN